MDWVHWLFCWKSSFKNVTKIFSNPEILEIGSFHLIYRDFFFIQNFISLGEFPFTREVGRKISKSGDSRPNRESWNVWYCMIWWYWFSWSPNEQNCNYCKIIPITSTLRLQCDYIALLLIILIQLHFQLYYYWYYWLCDISDYVLL